MLSSFYNCYVSIKSLIFCLDFEKYWSGLYRIITLLFPEFRKADWIIPLFLVYAL